MSTVTLENGMIVRIPVQLVDVRDRGNVRVLAGNRAVLMDGAFLVEAAEVVSTAPPAQKPQLDALAELLAKVQARLDALETAPPKGKADA